MNVEQAYTEQLFSYGTLQLESLQMATFGRLLAGASDALPGFKLVPVKIEDAKVVAVSGKEYHTMAIFTGLASDVVTGMVFAVTAAEIRQSDEYEVAAYKRFAVVLQSGVRAWAYLDAGHTQAL